MQGAFCRTPGADFEYCRTMPKEGVFPDRFQDLVPRWIDSLVEVIGYHCPIRPEAGQTPYTIAMTHLNAFPGVSGGKPGCKGCGAAQAVIFLHDVIEGHFDGLRRAAKLTTHLSDVL